MLSKTIFVMRDALFLTDTDTTIGFVSKESKAIDRAKSRQKDKKYIEALGSLKHLRKRVPKQFRRVARRAKKSTFVISQEYSFRIVKDKRHNLLMDRLESAFTSSANKSAQEYNFEYAYEHADIIIFPLGVDSKPSKIFKIGKQKIKKIR